MEYAIVEIGGKQVWVEEGQYFVTGDKDGEIKI